MKIEFNENQLNYLCDGLRWAANELNLHNKKENAGSKNSLLAEDIRQLLALRDYVISCIEIEKGIKED